jgi:hypothetical protein
LDEGSARRKAATYTGHQHRGTQTSMPRMGFKPTIPVFERAKIFRALDRAATLADTSETYRTKILIGPQGDQKYFTRNIKKSYIDNFCRSSLLNTCSSIRLHRECKCKPNRGRGAFGSHKQSNTNHSPHKPLSNISA